MKRLPILLFLPTCFALVLRATSGSDAPASDTFFEKHCTACHGDEKPAGGLKLTGISSDLDDAPNMAAWVRIFDRVSSDEMPPKDAEQPGDAEQAKFLAPLRGELHAASLAKQQREGRVLVRRLNRSEYQNTVHDLLGITTDLKSLLPEDSIVAGFDKVTSGLETSATHLVRYQEAADRALADVLPPEILLKEPVRQRFTGREYFDKRPKPNQEGEGPFLRFEGDTLILCATLYKHGSIHTAPAPTPGRYRFRASVGAVRSDGKSIPVLIGRISCDRFAHERLEHILEMRDTPADQRRVIDLEFTLPRGEQIYLEGLGLTFFMTLKEQLKGQPVSDDYAGPGLAVDWIELDGPLDAGVGYQRTFGSLPRVPNRFFADATAGKAFPDNWPQWHPNEFLTPQHRLRVVASASTALTDAGRLLHAFIPRAFRRPVSDELLASFIQPAFKQIEQGEPFDEVMIETYKAILCSPHFFMRLEKPGELDDFALASRLSYFLWDSMPDDELLAVAARGELKQPDVLRAQTERLLQHPRSQRFTESFTGQWLDLRNIHAMKPDGMYGEYDDLLAWSMPEETRYFFNEVLRQDLPTTSFLDSDWTMLNERLARHYGVQNVTGIDLHRVNLPKEAHRGGVMTHASVLKLSTNSTYTSPVKRGVWLLERILGTPPSPPPPNVGAIEPDIRGAVTIREQLAKHKSVAACASCHRQIDPPGFALENFDIVGGWRKFYRSKEGGDDKQYVELANYPGRMVWLAKPVESSGELASGEPFEDIDGFRQLVLRDRDQLTRNLTDKLLTYATGSPRQFADREVIEQIVARLRERNHGFRSLIHEVIQSRVFRMK